MDMDMTYQAAGFDWLSIISYVLNVVFGGGLIVTIYTLNAQKRQAEANADQAAAGAKQTIAAANTTEIQNMGQIAEEWKKFAEESELRYSSMNKLMQLQITSLQKDVAKLSKQLNQIVTIIKEMNHENLEQKKKEAEDVSRA